MAKTVDVAQGQQIASPWGNEIRDRTCQVFASAAERDAQWPTAPNGALCVTLDTNVLYRRIAGVWRAAPGTLYTSGQSGTGDTAMPAIGTVDSCVATMGIAPVPVRVIANWLTGFGFATGFVNATTDMVIQGTGQIGNGTNLAQAVASCWAFIPNNYVYDVAAGVEMGFKTRYTLVQAGGNYGFYNVRIAWQVFYK